MNTNKIFLNIIFNMCGHGSFEDHVADQQKFMELVATMVKEKKNHLIDKPVNVGESFWNYAFKKGMVDINDPFCGAKVLFQIPPMDMLENGFFTLMNCGQFSGAFNIFARIKGCKVLHMATINIEHYAIN